MNPARKIAAQVLRSFAAWPAPRKIWLCSPKGMACWSFILPPACSGTSSKIAVNDLDQLRRRLGVDRTLGRIDQMGADMILDHLHQQAVDCATATGDLMHDL